MTQACGPRRPSDGLVAEQCPRCGRVGRPVDRITPKALLLPSALVRLSADQYSFCSTADCPVVYFGPHYTFDRQDLAVPVFQKEPPGARIVCYCLSVSELDIHREVLENGRASAADRIRALVQAGRCACEVRNPQGGCCLGIVDQVARHTIAEQAAEATNTPAPTRRAAP